MEEGEFSESSKEWLPKDYKKNKRLPQKLCKGCNMRRLAVLGSEFCAKCRRIQRKREEIEKREILWKLTQP